MIDSWFTWFVIASILAVAGYWRFIDRIDLGGRHHQHRVGEYR